MESILVIGGTGRLGKPVVGALISAGYRVRILTRRPPNTTTPHIEWFKGDLQDITSLRNAMKDVSAIYLNLPETANRKSSFITEIQGVENVLQAVPAHVLILKLSEINAMENPHFYDLTLKFRSEERIRQSGNPYLIFRPTWFMESIPLILAQKSRVIYVGEQPHPLYWIAGQDFAQQVVTALQKRSQVENRIFNIQGMEALTFAEIIRRYIVAMGGGMAITRIPLWIMRLAGVFDAQQHANYELLSHYNRRIERFESAETWQLLGKPTTTIEQFVTDWKAQAHNKL